ncbi:unnamed protein product [Pedinophyceae sp. YPF-701]|nr:unnamed protein product [Pedinophyceae sp. YPF-701]
MKAFQPVRPASRAVHPARRGRAGPSTRVRAEPGRTGRSPSRPGKSRQPGRKAEGLKATNIKQADARTDNRKTDARARAAPGEEEEGIDLAALRAQNSALRAKLSQTLDAMSEQQKRDFLERHASLKPDIEAVSAPPERATETTPASFQVAAADILGQSSVDELYEEDEEDFLDEEDFEEEEFIEEEFEEVAPEPVAAAPAPAPAEVEFETHNAKELLAPRQDWLVCTVPEKPVAGAPLRVYFNRGRSETLRNRPRITLRAACNSWEVAFDDVDLMPAENVSRDGGADWWAANVKVPEETYDIQWVFTDGEGAFDNNFGNDYLFEVVGGVTQEQWIDGAAERLAREQDEQRKAEEEAAKRAAEEEERRKKEEDLNQARELVNQLRAQLEDLKKNPPKMSEVFMFDTPLVAGEPATFYYNAQNRPLHGKPDATLQLGFNGWQNLTKIPLKKAAAPPKGAPASATKDAQWWTCAVKVPKDAALANFVLFSEDNTWDNNGNMDFVSAVKPPAEFADDTEKWVESLIEENRREIYTARKNAEAAEAARMAARKARADAAREKALAVMRRQQRHVLYTKPDKITAGSTVELCYNPQDTPLSGRQSVWVRGGYNRWTHKKSFGPIEMTPPKAGESHFTAKIPVPKDAFKIDFVFSEDEGSDCQFDNRGGYDYHLPVEGSVLQEPGLHVTHIAVEMAPVAKVGGLGDVVTSLARAVKESGHLVEIVLPKYAFFNYSPLLQNMEYETEFDWGGTKIFVCSQLVEGVRVFFVEPKNGMFDTDTVYQGPGDEVRFDFFSKAALEFLLQSGRQPDILHCHDWSSATVANSYWADYHNYGLWKPNVVFTIHNLEFGQAKIGAAAYACQRFTTVSPTYAFEIGGHPAIAPNAGKFMGIRNGIDPDIWDPETDQFLPLGFTANTCVEGKAAARKALRERLGMTDWGDKPIVGCISRLTAQKGMHLIKHAAWRTKERGGQFVLLGSAPDPKIQGDFNSWADGMMDDNCRCVFSYDEPLSHLIYAAADFIVVPSMFEPCGLTQLTAMRYGTVPIVRHTGGLRDTIFDVDCDKARAAWEMEGSSDWERDGLDCTNGFAFDGTDPGALDYAMNRALDAYYNDQEWLRSLQKRVMEQDWSWNRPALDYIELYYSLRK